MRRDPFLPRIVFVFLMLAALAAQAQDPKFWAVVIGISKFPRLDPALQLEYADKDAAAFAKFIQSPRGRSFPAENVKLLLNQDATLPGVRTSLALWLNRNAKADDTIYIFLATHGVVDKELPRQTYLLTNDADPEDFYDTTLSMTIFGDILKTRLGKAARIVLLADACRSGKLGAQIGGDIQGNSTRKDGDKPSVRSDQELVGLLASGPREYSEEGKQFCGGHGAFSCYLLKGLDGDADLDKDKVVTVGELIKYLPDQVTKATSDKQTPQAFGDYAKSTPMSFVDKPGVDWNAANSLDFGPDLFNPWRHLPDLLASLSKEMTLAHSYLRFYFQQAIQDRRLLSPTLQNGWESYQKMAASSTPANELADARDALAVALEDEGQKIVRTYLRGDASPLTDKDYQAGAEYFARAAELNPEERKLKAKSRFCAGRALLIENRLREGETALRESVSIDPQGPYSHNALGIAYTKLRRYEEAIKELQSAFDQAPRWAYPHFNLAIAYEQMQRYREAEDQYKQAIERGPNYAYLYLNLGNLYLNQLHRQDDAERNFKKAIELHPDDRSYNMLGGFYELRGDLKLAEDNYRKGIAVDPKAVTARQNLARLLIDRNKKDEAEEALRTAVQIDPQNALSHLMFGQLLLDRGKLDEAEGEFLFLASTNPNDPQVLELLGDLHVKQKRFDEAIREYQQAAQLIPDPVMRAKIDRKLKAAEKQK